LPQQLPGTSNEQIDVPTLPSNNVIVNGERAGFPDIIASASDGLRLSQVKFTTDPDKSATLNLLKELGKSGVTKQSPWQSKQLLKYLMGSWRDAYIKQKWGDITTENEKELEYSCNHKNTKSNRNLIYPIAQHTTFMKYCSSFTKKENKDISKQVAPSNRNGTYHMIFVTNSESFHIPGMTCEKDASQKTVIEKAAIIGYKIEPRQKLTNIKKGMRAYMEKNCKSFKVFREDVKLNGELIDLEKIPKYIHDQLEISQNERLKFYFQFH
jgi:hypothetical protein